MTPEDKFFYLYLLTNPKTTQIGIYQITKKQMAFDLGYSPESINSLLHRFIHVHKRVIYNPETREIALINWGKYNLNRGGKPILDCVKAELKEIKDKSLIPIVGEHIQKPEIKFFYDSYNDTVNDINDTSTGLDEENTKITDEVALHQPFYDTSDDTVTIRGQEKEEEEEKEEENNKKKK
ncbi:hypothetical protein [Piscibacillus salipiscarius]|uniref:hypothetical protein n=1 Tax=Piscibacillus salipiscarius TaxID=299480 RepID=UPI0006D06961|nr:hypothetical protein [Piscibacillus salipiscarius]